MAERTNRGERAPTREGEPGLRRIGDAPMALASVPSPLAAAVSEMIRLFEDSMRRAVREEFEPLRRALAELRGDDREWLRVGEAARRLGVSPRTIQRRIKDGTLETQEFGGVRTVRQRQSLSEDDMNARAIEARRQ